MERKVYLTRLRPEFREEYLHAHRNVPSKLMDRYRDAGMRSCAVYLLEDYLVLVTEADDHSKVKAALENDPVDVEWQELMRPMKEEGDYREMTEVFKADLS
ncbi:MAG: L-rhamnose mutarotase [Bryobacteraceae bacterium]